MTIVSTPPTSDQDVTEAIEFADYQKGLPHFRLDTVRAGPGSGPVRLWNVESRDSTMASVSMDFPIFGHAHLSDDEVVVAVITSAPKLARWSGVDLHPGMVLVYGPGAHHAGHTTAGLDFTYLTLRVRGLGERIGFGTDMPAAGTLGVFQSIGGGKGVANDMEAIARHVKLNASPAAMSEGVEALIGLVMHKHPVVTSRRLATSRLIVAEFSKAADARRAAATVSDLSRAISTSPRRLRQAFGDTYGVPPKRYLQLRVLDRANERLATNGSRCNTVTQVATDLGISHMGRFAAQYCELFGEHPSTTLARARSLEVGGVA